MESAELDVISVRGEGHTVLGLFAWGRIVTSILPSHLGLGGAPWRGRAFLAEQELYRTPA